MDRSPSILSISYDESLLHTRAWILEAAGFNVTSALGFTQAVKHCQSAFDLIIMGHSIPRDDRQSLLDIIRSHNHTRILLMRRPGEPASDGIDYSIESWEGPEALVSTVEKALKLQKPYRGSSASPTARPVSKKTRARRKPR